MADQEPLEKVDPTPTESPPPVQVPQYTAEALKEFFSTDQGKELQKSLIDESLKSTLDQNRRFIERGDLAKVHPQLRGLIEVNDRKAAAEKAQVEATAREQAWLQQTQTWNPQQWEQWGRWVVNQKQTQEHLAPMVADQAEKRLAAIFDAVTENLPDDQKETMINSAIEMVGSGTPTHEAITAVLIGVADYMADDTATKKFDEKWNTFMEKDLPALLNTRIDALAAEKLGIKARSGDETPGGSPEAELPEDVAAARHILDNPGSYSLTDRMKAYQRVYGESVA